MKKRTKMLTLAVSVVMVLVCIVGGTLAWLTAESDEVVNTFTSSDIEIELRETKGGKRHEFKMVPGHTIDKDPVVTVTDSSEDCYLFVKLEKSNNFDEFLTYKMAEGWTELTEGNGVYYRIVRRADEVKSFSVLKDDQVVVEDEVTAEMMGALTDATRPTLTVTAYASQLYKNNTEKFTPVEAWRNVNPAAAGN